MTDPVVYIIDSVEYSPEEYNRGGYYNREYPVEGNERGWWYKLEGGTIWVWIRKRPQSQ